MPLKSSQDASLHSMDLADGLRRQVVSLNAHDLPAGQRRSYQELRRTFAPRHHVAVSHGYLWSTCGADKSDGGLSERPIDRERCPVTGPAAAPCGKAGAGLGL